MVSIFPHSMLQLSPKTFNSLSLNLSKMKHPWTTCLDHPSFFNLKIPLSRKWEKKSSLETLNSLSFPSPLSSFISCSPEKLNLLSFSFFSYKLLHSSSSYLSYLQPPLSLSKTSFLQRPVGVFLHVTCQFILQKTTTNNIRATIFLTTSLKKACVFQNSSTWPKKMRQ